MIKGFSLLEMLVVLSLTCILSTVAIAHVVGANRCSQKIINNQQRMEAIFHTVDSIRSDLTKCGMRLQEASTRFGFPLFEYNDQNFKVLYGTSEESLLADCWKGGKEILANRNDFFSKQKEVLIYDAERGNYEFNVINGISGNTLLLTYSLKNDYSKNSTAIVLKYVEYKIYPAEKTLKRKVNNGYFQPLLEEVTDFHVKFYPESIAVLYRLEINNKEQLRGYIFMSNMVEK
ncbi:MAG TPA: type II secretion system protein [Candidatus Kapabacteria bacterium]|nr:type II secretion system protein [Candidatus Kapabacteria bacterium]